MITIRKLTEENIKNNTYWAERAYTDILKKINKYEKDEDLESRLKNKECRTCFYLKNERISLQAFTNYDCRNCGTTHTYHNGGTPKYCNECSLEHLICVRCGGKL